MIGLLKRQIAKLGMKGWLSVIVTLVFVALIRWDHSFQSTGWVPSLGANLITMVATVLVLDTLQRRRQRQNAAAILRTAILSIDAVLAHTAQGYQAAPELVEGWWTPQINDWRRALEALRRDVDYCSADLPHPIRQSVRDLEEHVRTYAEDMTWETFRDEGRSASRRLNETWLLLGHIQRELYPNDTQLIGYLKQTEREDLVRMRGQFEKYW